MKKILHLSDLHFGTERPGIVEVLTLDCQALNADIIIISGDLTQRAKQEQFMKARKFLDNFPDKIILCVPGNHDIPLHNLIERFLYPFAKYKKWVSPTLCQHYADATLSILGINSVTPYKPMGGYVTDKQLAMVTDYFKLQPEGATRIVVMHHNLINSERHNIINDSDKILEVYANAGVNLVLSGHIHYPCIEKSKNPHLKQNLYVITAGTAISTRTIQPNSYNVIELHEKKFILTVRVLVDNTFVDSGAVTEVLF